MKSAFGITLILLAMLAFACAQKVNDPADVQAINKSMDDYAKACNAGDAEGAAALMTDKTTVAINNSPVLVGKEAVKSAFGAYFNQVKVEFSTPVDNVSVVGNLAAAKGTWAGKFIPKEEGVAPVTDSGRWVVIFARQNDGSWKWDCLTANSDQPAPGSTGSGEDEQALYQIERDWATAMVKRDTAVLDNLLANEFQANYADFVTNKKQFVAVIKSGSAKFESMGTTDMKAFVFGDTAIVHGLSTSKSSMAGRDTSGQQRYTDLFVKRDGRWQCVTGYSTRVQ